MKINISVLINYNVIFNYQYKDIINNLKSHFYLFKRLS